MSEIGIKNEKIKIIKEIIKLTNKKTHKNIEIIKSNNVIHIAIIIIFVVDTLIFFIFNGFPGIQPSNSVDTNSMLLSIISATSGGIITCIVSFYQSKSIQKRSNTK